MHRDRLANTRAHGRTNKALTAFTDSLAASLLPEPQTLLRTRMQRPTEVPNDFRFRVTDGQTGGFDNRAQLVKGRAYRYEPFHNYRLRLLHPCA